MAFTGWKKHRESILLRFVDGGSEVKGGQVEMLEEYFEADVRTARQIKQYDLSLLGTSEFSLAGLIASLNASAITSTAALTADLAAANKTIAELQAKLAALTTMPDDRIESKYIRTALAKLSLYDFWQKAIDLAIQVLTVGNDPNPDRLQGWFDDSDQLSPHDPEWILIVVQMGKAGFWKSSSEAEMLALARDIQSP